MPAGVRAYGTGQVCAVALLMIALLFPLLLLLLLLTMERVERPLRIGS